MAMKHAPGCGCCGCECTYCSSGSGKSTYTAVITGGGSPCAGVNGTYVMACLGDAAYPCGTPSSVCTHPSWHPSVCRWSLVSGFVYCRLELGFTGTNYQWYFQVQYCEDIFFGPNQTWEALNDVGTSKPDCSTFTWSPTASACDLFSGCGTGSVSVSIT